MGVFEIHKPPFWSSCAYQYRNELSVYLSYI